MTLPLAPLPFLLRHWPIIAPRISATVRRGLFMLVANNPLNRDGYRFRDSALNRPQEELS
jgi:hypothetical protein